MKKKIARLLFKILKPYIIITSEKSISEVSVVFSVSIFGEKLHEVEFSGFEIINRKF